MLTSISPWDGTPVWRAASATTTEAASAVAAAVAAFPAWALEVDRAGRIRRFAEAVLHHRKAVVTLLVREAGKTTAEAEAEADQLGGVIDTTLGAGLGRTPGVPAFGHALALPWRPRGPAVVIAPGNQPLLALHQLVVPALAVGCTVVAKPSPEALGLGELYRALLKESGLDGVCAVLLGGCDVAEAIVDQPGVATVAATGSRAMGAALARRLAGRSEVVFAASLGGVNPVLVLPDADLPAALIAVAESAWRLAGQHGTASRVLFVPRAQLDAALEQLGRERQRWLPAPAPDGAVGPMRSIAARAAFLAGLGELPAGTDPIAGRREPLEKPSAGTDPLLFVLRPGATAGHPLLTREHAGPLLAVVPYDDAAQAAAWLEANPHRLAAAIWTADRARFLDLARRLRYGRLYHNRSTLSTRLDLPAAACGLSGTGQASGVAACQIFADETVVW